MPEVEEVAGTERIGFGKGDVHGGIVAVERGRAVIGDEGHLLLEQVLDAPVTFGDAVGDDEALDHALGDQLAIGVELAADVGGDMQEMAADLGAAAGDAAQRLEDDRVLELEVHQRGDPGDGALEQGAGLLERAAGHVRGVAELRRRLMDRAPGALVDRGMVAQGAAHRCRGQAEPVREILDGDLLGHRCPATVHRLISRHRWFS